MEAITRVDQLIHGLRVTCMIENLEILDAKIAISFDKAYICQNLMVGEDSIIEKFGYKYAWNIYNSSASDWLNAQLTVNGVTRLFVAKEQDDSYYLKKDDETLFTSDQLSITEQPIVDYVVEDLAKTRISPFPTLQEIAESQPSRLPPNSPIVVKPVVKEIYGNFPELATSVETQAVILEPKGEFELKGLVDAVVKLEPKEPPCIYVPELNEGDKKFVDLCVKIVDEQEMKKVNMKVSEVVIGDNTYTPRHINGIIIDAVDSRISELEDEIADKQNAINNLKEAKKTWDILNAKGWVI